MLKNRACPSCKSDAKSVVVCSKSQSDLLDFSRTREFFVGLRPEQLFFDYVRCKTCTLVYCDTYFDESELSILYSNMPPNLVGDEIDIVDRTHFGYAKRIIRKCKGKSGRSYESLLELGADLGLVTGPVVHQLGIKNGVLVEPNKVVRSDLHCSVNNREDFEIIDDIKYMESSRKFDLVIAVHVIDHLLEPKLTIQNLYSRIENEGKIFIVVHNQRSILARLLKSKWPPYCLQHPQVFDEKTIRDLLRNVGFKKIEISRTTNYVGLKNGLKSLLDILKLPSSWTRYLPNVAIPFKFGNILVEAEK